MPVQAVIAARIRSLPPIYKLCTKKNETVMHALFHCDFTRAAQMAPPMGLRTGQLTGKFRDTVIEARNSLSDHDLCDFASMAWAVRRVRNEVVYGDNKPSFTKYNEYFQKSKEACKLQAIIVLQNVPEPSAQCSVLSAQNMTIEGGHRMLSQSIQVLSASQDEAWAILEGHRLLVKQANGTATVLLDCRENITLLCHDSPQIHDWRSYKEIWQTWILQSEYKESLKTQYYTREDHGIKTAHLLANQGRIYSWERNDFASPSFQIEKLL